MLGALAVADTKPQTNIPNSPIEVSIAVSMQDGRRIVNLSESDPHIDVVLRNISTKPVNIWAEDNSAGYNNLHLEITPEDQGAGARTIIIERVIRMWTRNMIHLETLMPGDSVVREVHFVNNNPIIGFAYRNFPPMNAGLSHTYKIRAVFQSPGGQGFNHSGQVWAGTATSPAQDYYFTMFSP
jgi:hypothetical protein